MRTPTTNTTPVQREIGFTQVPAIEIDHLTVSIEGHKIFSGLDLRLLPRQKMTLIGRSGSGKSTLLRCLLGFVAPVSGTIRVFGRELTGSSVWELRSHMAYVAQEPEMAAGLVRDILERPFTFKRNRHLRENLSRMPSLLNRLHLPESLLEKEVSVLSGGEKQRVALLSALLLDREILLLDEASSALDQISKLAVIDLLKSKTELTILSVSHDREWMGFSDTVVDLSGKGKGGEA
jgi:putative ABC transport system ATP-binding protein